MNTLKCLIVFVGLIFLAGCSSDNPVEEISNNILIKSIIINGGNIEDGTAKQLSLDILPNNATNKTVIWSVSDEAIAKISSSGILTPIDNGTLTVSVIANDDSATSAEKIFKISGVSGQSILVNSITISGSDITDGNPQQLSVEILPADATNKLVTWTVSDPLLADISSDGVLTPKDNGAITITATAADVSGVTNQFIMNISGVTPVYATILKAENMLLWQRSNGGWPKEPYNDFSGYERTQTANEISTANNTKDYTDTTIDNNHTVGELKFLLSAYKSTNNPDYLDAVIRAIDYLFEAQYDNGGWPQYYPLRDNYSRHITYNDNAMGNVMNLMKDIINGNSNTDVLDASYVAKAQTAFDKGIQVILDTQVVINGIKTAWCAQHDAVTLAPATARSYELASNSGSESVGVVRLLMDLENPSSEVIDAVNSAIAWFESVKIVGYALQSTGSDKVLVESPGNVMWGRFYSLEDYAGFSYASYFGIFGPNEAFFCSRDGIPRKTIAEISHERRNGYSWYGSWPKNLISSEYASWKSKHGI
ncbi:pectate lyase [Thalassobellus sediminis]|uniref:pectate lyase n=1 Tax=Thalassobellus sediminis TaxID=3367753 RepID=UPI00378C34A9